jgi:hypothetical protein
MASFTKEKFWAELASLGEAEVRIRIANQRYSSSNHERSLAEEWLRQEEASRTSEAAAKRDAREEETLAIARDALSISERATKSSERANEIADSARVNSRRANIIAISAIVLSIITAIIITIIQIMYAKP